MPNFTTPPALDYLAVFAWAVSGALVGARKNFDFVGAFITALVASLGAGLMRDGMLLQKTPPMVSNPFYLPLVAFATLLAVVFARRLADGGLIGRAIRLLDSVGTPAFAVIGVESARAAGLPAPGAVLVGCVSGVGGGVLRDIVVREIPEIMKPGRYQAILVALASIFDLTLTAGLDVAPTAAAWTTVVLYMALRYATSRFDWRTRPILADSERLP